MVREDGISHIHKKIVWAIMSLAAVLSIGTSGYWLIGDRQYSILDCFYKLPEYPSSRGQEKG